METPSNWRNPPREVEGVGAGRIWPLAGSIVFFVIAPGSLAGWLPYWLEGWQFRPPLLDFPPGRIAGVLLIVFGTGMLVDCFARFALEGRGTPAPVVPTERLIASGLYRYVRNPMYAGVLFAITGQALLFGSSALLAYAALVWLLFHTFVLIYEEPVLRHRYGASYETYRANVRRWLPRLQPWKMGT
jgi:protein-S-isoprenylcysteine O-methyltransferase Ste14